MNLNQEYSKELNCATIWVSNVCFTGVLVNVLNNDIYIEKPISCTAAVNFLTAKGFKLWEKTFQHILNKLLNFEILGFWALHLPQLTRNCSGVVLALLLQFLQSHLYVGLMKGKWPLFPHPQARFKVLWEMIRMQLEEGGLQNLWSS